MIRLGGFKMDDSREESWDISTNGGEPSPDQVNSASGSYPHWHVKQELGTVLYCDDSIVYNAFKPRAVVPFV
jgi:hypothetical protein